MFKSSGVLGPQDRVWADQVTALTRRRFLKAVMGGAAAGPFAGLAHRAFGKLSGFDLPDEVDVNDLDPLLQRLVNRTTFGFTPALYEEVEELGFDEFVETQLHAQGIDDALSDAMISGYDTLTMTSDEIYTVYEEDDGVPIRQLVEATILRSVFSKRQLQERMVEFWSDHFNIDILDGLVPFLKTADDRDVIRTHALSTFPQLLNASAHSAAMLFYLDNYANSVGHAQENYARELMELHTLGVDGPYTQQDVEEVSRCLTGWTIANRDNPLGFGSFVFYPPYHDTGSKTVLGQFIPAGGGESDGQTVLDILAYHPSTAAFIAGKLCKRFCAYDPPQQLIDDVRDTYLATGGDIKSMLRVILTPNVLHSMATPKFKRPFHLMASLLRASNASIQNPRLLLEMLFIMGHAPFFWPRPDGYPDDLSAWATSLLPRWQFVSYLFDGVFPGVSVDVDSLIESRGLGQGYEVSAIDQVLGQPFTTVEVDLLNDFVAELPAQYAAKFQDALGVATTMPGFQWY